MKESGQKLQGEREGESRCAHNRSLFLFLRQRRGGTEKKAAFRATGTTTENLMMENLGKNKLITDRWSIRGDGRSK